MNGAYQSQLPKKYTKGITINVLNADGLKRVPIRLILPVIYSYIIAFLMQTKAQTP
jgi:hypothetical protein